MEKRVVVIIILGLLLRSITFETSYFLGSDDTFHHAMVVDYYKTHGFSKTIYSLDPCMERNITEPLGFYLLPVIMPFDAASSINISILIVYVIISVLFYFYTRKVSKDFALISTLLLAFSFANIGRSNMWYYRGEHLIMPFIFASLIFIANPLLSGLISGLSSFVWNGYPLAIIIYNLTLILPLLVDYLKKKKPVLQVKNFFLSNLAVLTVLIIKNIIAASNYDLTILIYFLAGLVLCSAFFIVLVKVRNKNSKFKIAMLVLLLAASIAAAYYIISLNSDIISLISPDNGFFSSVNELEGFRLDSRLFLVFNLFLLFPVGLFFFYRKEFNKLIFYLGLIIPALILFLTALRFEYVASYAIVIGFSYLLYSFREERSYSKILICAFALVLLISLFDISTVKPLINSEEINLAKYLTNSSYKEFCIETMWDKASIYQYFGLKTSTDSVSGQFRSEKIVPLYKFFINNDSYPFTNKSLLILEQSFWAYMPYMTALLNKTEHCFLEVLSREDNNTFSGSSGLKYHISFTPFQAYISNGSQNFIPSETYLQLDNNTVLLTPANQPFPTINGCLIIYSFNAAFFASENLCRTRLASLLLNRYSSEFSLVYSTYWTKAYKYIG